jgi:dephospho-CoA kinase
MSGESQGKPFLTVGLTGGIASGKSTVDVIFEELGARVIDADRIVHRLLAADGAAAGPVLAAFGSAVAGADGGVDRRALGAIVFADPEARQRLEWIVHPLVTAEIGRLLAGHREQPTAPIVIVDAALLVESGADRMFDGLIVVTCSEESQIARLAASRGLGREEAVRRIRAQASSEVKAARADFRIDNDGPLERTRERVREVYALLLARLEAERGG